jgi:predicted flap endonuclease-1-like 5' DNA nuclease
MIFLQLDPLSKSVAITEMVLLLAGAALVGWLVARWIMAGQIRSLREALAEREVELDECRATRSQSYPQPTPSLPVNHLVAAPAAVVSATDNLKLVEGIGPKIEELLNAGGISTFARLAVTPPERLSEILKVAGPRFQMHSPGTWPEQAALARDGKWEELKAMQSSLRAGRS